MQKKEWLPTKNQIAVQTAESIHWNKWSNETDEIFKRPERQKTIKIIKIECLIIIIFQFKNWINLFSGKLWY